MSDSTTGKTKTFLSYQEVSKTYIRMKRRYLPTRLSTRFRTNAIHLNSLYPDKWLRKDSLLARKALVEGDARYFDWRYMEELLTNAEKSLLFTSFSGGGSSGVREIKFFSRIGSFPYNEGAWFVSKLVEHGGVKGLHQAFANPPQSTEQILWPNKYLDGEAPVQVDMPDFLYALGPSWYVLDSGAIGEFILRLHLENHLDEWTALKCRIWMGRRQLRCGT